MTPPVPVSGPWFEDFKTGQVFAHAPAVTLTDGLAALPQALSGDRLRLPLDHELSRWVTGRSRPLAHPTLVCHVAIGQTTAASQRVKGNLFYRRPPTLRPLHPGAPPTPRAQGVARRPNRPNPAPPAPRLGVL